MNAKTCKLLRKEARIETQARKLPDRKYVVEQRKTGKRVISRIVNAAHSNRGFYRQLKKEMKK